MKLTGVVKPAKSDARKFAVRSEMKLPLNFAPMPIEQAVAFGKIKATGDTAPKRKIKIEVVPPGAIGPPKPTLMYRPLPKNKKRRQLQLEQEKLARAVFVAATEAANSSPTPKPQKITAYVPVEKVYPNGEPKGEWQAIITADVRRNMRKTGIRIYSTTPTGQSGHSYQAGSPGTGKKR